MTNYGPFESGVIAVGGTSGYIEILNSNGDHLGFVHVLDNNDIEQRYITGLTFRPPTGHLFSVSTPGLTVANAPHDIDWLADDTGLLIAYVPEIGVLKFRKVNYDGETQTEWTPDVETGWAQEPVKISVACDATTVYYTMSGKVIKRYNLDDKENLTDYQTLPASSPYRFGGIKVIWTDEYGDARDVVIAMTQTGDGPQHAVCLDSNKTSFWCDEVNPDSGIYHIQKRKLTDRSLEKEVVTKSKPLLSNETEYQNTETLALACNYDPCQIFPGISRFDNSANLIWFTRSSSGV